MWETLTPLLALSETIYVVLIGVGLLLLLVFALLVFKYFNLWLQCITTHAGIGFIDLIAMSLRKITPGRLLCLFGCGGNRDRGKRPQMGRVAARLSDRVFVTSDNPREEDPGDIIREILSGMNGGAPREVEPDRRMALRRALLALGPGDVLLVAGKGHEDYQEIAGRRIPFSDREEVKRLVQELS